MRPVTLQERAPTLQVQVFPPGEAVTVYFVITAPPFDNGANHDTVTEPFAATPVTERGAPGIVRGVTPRLGVDDDPVPMEFVATTANV